MDKSYRVSLFLTVFFMISAVAGAQKLEPLDILRKASDKVLSDKYYSYNAKYTMYYDQETNDIQDSYSGCMIRKNGISYYKIKNTEFVNFPDYTVKVNKDEKAILVAKEAKKTAFPMDVSSYLKGFNVKLIGNDKSMYVCELMPAEISQIMFSKIIIYVNKKDYSIVKQRLYFLNPVKNKGKIAKPSMEVLMTPRPKKPIEDDALLTQKNYFTTIKGELQAAGRFAKYKLYKA